MSDQSITKKNIAFPLYFNHIPKCGGTSLNEVLSRNLRSNQIGAEPFYSVTELYTLRSELFDRLDLVASHVPHWVATRRLRGWTKVTILRKPWTRFQSLCRHLLRIEGSEPRTLWPTQIEFLDLLHNRRYDNALRQAVSWYPAEMSMTSYLLPYPAEGSLLPRSALDDATGVLRQYDLVFLAEKTDECIVRFDQVLNGQSFGIQARLNTSAHYGDRSQGPFPDEYSSVFARLYPYENDLYEIAAELYAQTKKWLLEECEAGRFGPKTASRRTSPMYRLDWEAPTRCGGFSDRMFAASVGYEKRVARRVESDVAILEFSVPRSAQARIEAVFWLSPIDSRFAVEFRLNGTVLTFFDETREIGCLADPNQVWTGIDLPQQTLGDGHCRLEIDRRHAADLKELWLLDLEVRET
jgi:hypothetical protein